MNFVPIIEARRDGRDHSEEELIFLANGAASGEISDEQLAAWLMACYLRPMNDQQTGWLTRAMANSGERLDLSGLPKPWVDKHSTGGVGDKTTIVLLPILASLGLTMVKMSGAGLGITGGTVDKLAAVGMNMAMTPEELIAQAKKIGVSITGQTPRLAPADGKLYALRDVTGTVPSIPLIASSILSKKIAGEADVVGFDVKVGSGALMKTLDEAKNLATWLCNIGKSLGMGVHATLSDMDQPLGRCAGNRIEVIEAIETLRGGGEANFRELCISLAEETLKAVDMGTRSDVEKALESGAALRKCQEWFEAQGVDWSALTESKPVLAPHQLEILCDHAGFVERVDAEAVGRAVIRLGGGRTKKTDSIDPLVGVETLVKVGDRVEVGQPMFVIHARTADFQIDGKHLASVTESPVPRREVILGHVSG